RPKAVHPDYLYPVALTERLVGIRVPVLAVHEDLDLASGYHDAAHLADLAQHAVGADHRALALRAHDQPADREAEGSQGDRGAGDQAAIDANRRLRCIEKQQRSEQEYTPPR